MATSRGRTWTLLNKQKALSVHISTFDILVESCVEFIFVLDKACIIHATSTRWEAVGRKRAAGINSPLFKMNSGLMGISKESFPFSCTI